MGLFGMVTLLAAEIAFFLRAPRLAKKIMALAGGGQPAPTPVAVTVVDIPRYVPPMMPPPEYRATRRTALTEAFSGVSRRRQATTTQVPPLVPPASRVRPSVYDDLRAEQPEDWDGTGTTTTKIVRPVGGWR